MHRLVLIMLLGISSSTLLAQATNNSPQGPKGADAHWLGAAKDGFGTSNTLQSRVWFTLTEGVLSEVYYPTLDVPNVQCLELIIVTPEGKVETERLDTIHTVTISDDARSLSFRQENKALSGDYVIQKTYVTDPQRDVLLVDVSFHSTKKLSATYKLYVYFDPSLNNSGLHDSGWTRGAALLAADGDRATALIADPAFAETNNGFLGSGDGFRELRAGKELDHTTRAADGNVVQLGRPGAAPGGLSKEVRFTLALGFGSKPELALAGARASMRRKFARIQRDYQAGWQAYTNGLPEVERKYRRQFKMAALVLRGLEDKTYRGAMIASPSIPWGGGPNANEATISGYHAVWSRDLYEVATAFDAIGDRAAALRALDYLFRIQQKSDGSFPQNTRVDGRPLGGALQLDEVAFPLVLAHQLGRTDRNTWLKHIKPAADFITRKGPASDQERWEEKSGYSPSTIAAEIAGLVCAAQVARLNGDRQSANAYLKTADDWASNVERWTATTSGPYGKGHYYLRITENDDPNDGAKVEINSGGGTYDEREIVDAGFLELVRLGIKSAGEPLVRASLAVVDKLIKVETPVGAAWYRYNHDAYGERPDGGPYDGHSGVGRLWALLTGERGEYELATGDKTAASKRLDTLMALANDGMMIPEQSWDRKEHPSSALHLGSGTGAATPLAWSMAQFIRLAVNIKSGRNLETPQVVSTRYLNNSRRGK
ncbi:MAG: glucan 1,4-alpha-glucosidase [Acidobacteria bacterium]|nr:glucan 1,4-alpha-glucosidase [Acidobacteriota bacterium]